MGIFEKIKEWTDVAGITDKSKIYTPFTFLCVFFAIYYNSEPLLKVWLEPDLNDKIAALKLMTEVDAGLWLMNLSNVIFSALGMTAVYAIGQVASAGLWSLGNWANAWISYIANRPKYKLIDDYNVIVNAHDEHVETIKSQKGSIAQYAADIGQRDEELAGFSEKFEKQGTENSTEKAGIIQINEHLRRRLTFIHDYYSYIGTLKRSNESEQNTMIVNENLVDYALNMSSKISLQVSKKSIKTYNIADDHYNSALAKVLAIFSFWQGGKLGSASKEPEPEFIFIADEIDFKQLDSDLNALKQIGVRTASSQSAQTLDLGEYP